jgi:hypothetical protein
MTTRDGALFDLAFGISNNSMLMEKRTPNSTVYCPECMADFSSLHKMYTHLHYVHRLNSTTNDRPICRICEKEIDPANASRHADNHPETDLPFVCQCCSYRCNSRGAFLIHFERHHNNGTTLVCPFCLEKFSVKRPSKVEGKRGLVTAHHFVEHVLDHFRSEFISSLFRNFILSAFTKKISCYRCNIKLCATTHKELEEKLDEHGEWHRSVKLKVERKCELIKSFISKHCLYSTSRPL